METEFKTMMNIEACCDASKVIAAMPASEKQVLVGVLFGNASDFIQRANPAGGAAFKGVGGSFKIVPTITDEKIGGTDVATSSGNLFLPGPAFTIVKDALTKVLYPHPDKPEKKARGAVEFCALIYIARSDSADGFAWGIDWLARPAPIDALAPLEAKYADEIAKRSPKIGTEQAPAPATAPKAARRA